MLVEELSNRALSSAFFSYYVRGKPIQGQPATNLSIDPLLYIIMQTSHFSFKFMSLT